MDLTDTLESYVAPVKSRRPVDFSDQAVSPLLGRLDIFAKPYRAQNTTAGTVNVAVGVGCGTGMKNLAVI